MTDAKHQYRLCGRALCHPWKPSVRRRCLVAVGRWTGFAHRARASRLAGGSLRAAIGRSSRRPVFFTLVRHGRHCALREKQIGNAAQLPRHHISRRHTSVTLAAALLSPQSVVRPDFHIYASLARIFWVRGVPCKSIRPSKNTREEGDNSRHYSKQYAYRSATIGPSCIRDGHADVEAGLARA